MQIRRTERGWAGHFICADNCRFRRNTLLVLGGTRVVVSTVGNMCRDGEIKEIGDRRYYETMVFYAGDDGPYVDANVMYSIMISSKWGVWADTLKELPKDVDNRANEMHERIVAEVMDRMQTGDIKE